VEALHSSWWLPHPKWHEPFSPPLHKLIFFHSFQFISIFAFHIVEPSGVQALKNQNPLKDVEALVVLGVAVLV